MHVWLIIFSNQTWFCWKQNHSLTKHILHLQLTIFIRNHSLLWLYYDTVSTLFVHFIIYFNKRILSTEIYLMLYNITVKYNYCCTSISVKIAENYHRHSFCLTASRWDHRGKDNYVPMYPFAGSFEDQLRGVLLASPHLHLAVPREICRLQLHSVRNRTATDFQRKCHHSS